MGLRPVLGRLLGPSDDGPNANGAVVLTYKFWRESLHSDPKVLGKTVRLESMMGARVSVPFLPDSSQPSACLLLRAVTSVKATATEPNAW